MRTVLIMFAARGGAGEILAGTPYLAIIWAPNSTYTKQYAPVCCEHYNSCVNKNNVRCSLDIVFF